MNKWVILCVAFFAMGHGRPILAQSSEHQWMKSLYQHRPVALDQPMIWTSRTTTPLSASVPVALTAVGFIRKDTSQWMKGLYVAESYAINGVLTLAMKYSIQRERPFQVDPSIVPMTDGFTPSFPSGHTSEAFSTATSLTHCFPKWYVAAPAFLWASAVGYSRIHTGVHYPTDVAMGALVGAGSAWLSQWLNRKIFDLQTPPSGYGR